MYNRTIFTNQCRLIHIVINSINLKIISNTPVINNINQGIAYHEKHVHYLESIESKLPLRLLSSLRNTSCRSCLPLALTHSTKSSEESISITYRDKKKPLVLNISVWLVCLLKNEADIIKPSLDNASKFLMKGKLLQSMLIAMSSKIFKKKCPEIKIFIQLSA